MKKSAIWTTAGIAAVGFGVPAYAAISSPQEVKQIAPSAVVTVPTTEDSATVTSLDDSKVTVVSTPASLPTISLTVNSTSNSVEDVTGNCDEAEHANDAACAGTATSVDDDATSNSVEDVSGNCDEAEHANDAACASGATPVDNSTHTSVDDNPHTSVDDSAGHGGSGGSGNGGADDSSHGGKDG